jgi:hypothetical protein
MRLSRGNGAVNAKIVVRKDTEGSRIDLIVVCATGIEVTRPEVWAFLFVSIVALGRGEDVFECMHAVLEWVIIVVQNHELPMKARKAPRAFVMLVGVVDFDTLVNSRVKTTN